MIEGQWLDCTITIATSTTVSAAVDLGKTYEKMMVYIPTITSATLSCYVSETLGGTYKALNDSTVAGTGDYHDIWNIGGHRFIKIVSSAVQAANRTFRVRGVRS